MQPVWKNIFHILWRKRSLMLRHRKIFLHEEMHTKPDYVVAHGIASTIGEKRVVIGSYHFVFEDEKCMIPEEKKELFENLPLQYSHLYLAIDGKLAATICIEDPLRTEAKVCDQEAA